MDTAPARTDRPWRSKPATPPEGHCQRLADYATRLGRALDLDADDLSALERGGYLHDIGKIAVPDGVLLKPGPLTPAECAQMKAHTLIGDRLCGELRSLRRVRPIVRHHHERLDGSGYPDGLHGDAIPLLAQVMGIVDVYDALTTTRPYKPAFTPGEAIAENALIESFNGRLRDECLNVYSFESIAHAQAVITAWRDDYNDCRPHGALGHLTPSEYAQRRQQPTPEATPLQLDPVW